MQSVETAPTTRPATLPAAIGGITAYVVGYAVTYLWQSDAVGAALQSYNAVLALLGGDPIPTWTAVGWLFYNAHAVAFSTPAVGGSRLSRNLIIDGNAPLVLLLVPAGLLVVAGFIAGRHDGTPRADRGLRVGVRVTAGYAVAAVLGVALFRFTAGTATVHVEYALGVLVAGIGYPAVFGAAGGALAAVTR
ncbi:transporter [Halobacterium salinarum]|uniref:DUF7978 domain-containing protein n=5 Tax=Halobacterium salinarum TaxID=2242 RepID=Q9HPI6_HALSA|nr:hypothetical protein [Halobacterium salinarum]AAG19881.1 hypothetical protein VNG_1619H [Halobacterium salinarum NRC-1]MBB6088888.1 hypothetical protein [Halobacterium salinarum]MDL0121060.1 transporter [Halobacterium salinarum]MDL0131335.1 transporter [Halobacterium salinarum]MDL0138483.1 transporter [Halobacterium salinarum]